MSLNRTSWGMAQKMLQHAVKAVVANAANKQPESNFSLPSICIHN